MSMASEFKEFAVKGNVVDLAARVFKGSPAPKNLVIPAHRYESDAVVVIGEDTKGA